MKVALDAHSESSKSTREGDCVDLVGDATLSSGDNYENNNRDEEKFNSAETETKDDDFPLKEKPMCESEKPDKRDEDTGEDMDVSIAVEPNSASFDTTKAKDDTHVTEEAICQVEQTDEKRDEDTMEDMDVSIIVEPNYVGENRTCDSNGVERLVEYNGGLEDVVKKSYGDGHDEHFEEHRISRMKQRTDSTADDSSFFDVEDLGNNIQVTKTTDDGCRVLPSRKEVPRRWKLKGKKSSGSGKSLNEQTRQDYIFVVCAGLALSFNSGYINGCCLSGLLLPGGDGIHQSVAGFTGTYTKSGLALAAGDTNLFGFELSMILSFILGAAISALINPRAKAYRLGPTYGPTFLVGSVLLTIASIMAFVYPSGRTLFYFAAAANGLQNGMSSMYSGNLIRSTHLTGTSTDMGLIIGQMLRGNRVNEWKLWVLLGLTVSFWFGGFTSFYATTAFRGYSLIFNAALFFIIGVVLIIFLVVTRHISIWQAAMGTWHWEKALETLSMNFSFRGEKYPTNLMLEMFDRIDVDGDGFIHEDELYDALRCSGLKVSRKGVKAMINVADEDNDGLISRFEWEGLIMNAARKDSGRSSEKPKSKILHRLSTM